MDWLIFAVFRRGKITGLLALLVLAAVLFATARTAAERYSAGVIVFSLGVCGWVTAWAVGRAERIVERDEMLLEETLHRMTQIAERMKAHPPTAASGQEAMDMLRNIWGERAEEWLSKSDLN